MMAGTAGTAGFSVIRFKATCIFLNIIYLNIIFINSRVGKLRVWVKFFLIQVKAQVIENRLQLFSPSKIKRAGLRPNLYLH